MCFRVLDTLEQLDGLIESPILEPSHDFIEEFLQSPQFNRDLIPPSVLLKCDEPELDTFYHT